MDIILYLLNFIQYQHKQICWLLNFICKYIPLKQWAFDDSHSPEYQKFKVDAPPIILKPEKYNYKELIAYFHERYGKLIKPVAIRMIYDCYEAVNIPIIGMGGISNAYDCLEFLMAGASALGIGTYNLVNPYICQEIIEDLPRVLEEYGFKDINECIGYAHRK